MSIPLGNQDLVGEPTILQGYRGMMGARGPQTDITPELLAELDLLEQQVKSRKQYLLTLKQQNIGLPGVAGIAAPLSKELSERVVSIRKDIAEIETLISLSDRENWNSGTPRGPSGPPGPPGLSAGKVLLNILNMERMRLYSL